MPTNEQSSSASEEETPSWVTHVDQDADIEQDEDNSTSDEQEYTCGICEAGFHSEGALGGHILNIHLDEEQTPDDAIRQGVHTSHDREDELDGSTAEENDEDELGVEGASPTADDAEQTDPVDDTTHPPTALPSMEQFSDDDRWTIEVMVNDIAIGYADFQELAALSPSLIEHITDVHVSRVTPTAMDDEADDNSVESGNSVEQFGDHVKHIEDRQRALEARTYGASSNESPIDQTAAHLDRFAQDYSVASNARILGEVLDALDAMTDVLDAQEETDTSLRADLDQLRTALHALEAEVEELSSAEFVDRLEAQLGHLNVDLEQFTHERTIQLDGEEVSIVDAVKQLHDSYAYAEHLRESLPDDLEEELTELRSDVETIKQTLDIVSAEDERARETDDIRREVRELERENRAIKELIEGLHQRF